MVPNGESFNKIYFETSDHIKLTVPDNQIIAEGIVNKNEVNKSLSRNDVKMNFFIPDFSICFVGVGRIELPPDAPHAPILPLNYTPDYKLF